MDWQSYTENIEWKSGTSDTLYFPKKNLLSFSFHLHFISLTHFIPPPSHSHHHFTWLHSIFTPFSFHSIPSIKVPLQDYFHLVGFPLVIFVQFRGCRLNFRSWEPFPQPEMISAGSITLFSKIQSTVSAKIMKCRCNWAKDMGHLQDIKEEQLVRNLEQELTKFPKVW